MSDRLKPGDLFAERYRIERFIAKGGFGVVYAAEQVDTEAKVALKIIWSHVVESDAALEQFKLEARLASRVGSEHVPRVFDVGRDPDGERPFLVMELLDGMHLEELVRTRGPVPPATLVEYFRQLGHALDRAHGYVDKEGVRRPIVHRDLKPENLFLTRRDGGAPVVKILDFGLAKMTGGAASQSRDLKGTPLFMAYEQASVGPITPQTDIWALGLIAFYLHTGRCYWLAANSRESPVTRLFTEVLSAPLALPSVRARLLGAKVIPSSAFDVWFARCVNRDRTKRFETAGECASELAAALADSSAAIETTLVSFVPVAMPTVHSLPQESAAAGAPLTPGSSLERRRSFGRHAVSVVFGVMLLLLASAGVVATQRHDLSIARAAAQPVPASHPTAGAALDTPGNAEPPITPAVLRAPEQPTRPRATPTSPPRPHATPRGPVAPVAQSASPPQALPEDPYDHR